MPAGLLGPAAMPFGFDDGVFWAIMGIGIDWTIVVTRWVAALPSAVGRMAAFGAGPLIASSAGIILLGLPRGRRCAGREWALLAVALVWAVRGAAAGRPGLRPMAAPLRFAAATGGCI